jgi:hypothetical protein
MEVMKVPMLLDRAAGATPRSGLGRRGTVDRERCQELESAPRRRGARARSGGR